MGIFNRYITDPKMEQDGVWIDVGEVNDKGQPILFRISRMGRSNKRYQKALEIKTKPYLYQMRHGQLSQEVDERLTLDLFCENILIDWKNLTCPELFAPEEHSENGCVPFSVENAKRFMKALPELYHSLKEQATTASNFRAEEMEQDAKN